MSKLPSPWSYFPVLIPIVQGVILCWYCLKSWSSLPLLFPIFHSVMLCWMCLTCLRDLLRDLSNGIPIGTILCDDRSQNDHQQRTNARQLNEQVDLQSYEVPIIDPTASFQDHQQIPHLRQLQVNLRPDVQIMDSSAPRLHPVDHPPSYEEVRPDVQIMDSSAPSAPRLDPVDLPPSYEEAVKMTISSNIV